MTREWWRDSVVYQLYVKSFADSDGDGIGDLDGIVRRLDHIADLGVDGIWLNPCYPSPDRDGGYDVADYLDIDAQYGGLRAFERLRDACHERGLKLLMDLVPNHCSDQHVWFQQALAAPPGSPERARFIFADGRDDQPPNNWRSTFGGPAWTRLPDGQWYLHSFDASQPDFNWENPEVAAMFDDVLRIWFDRGVDGFRIDVAYAMVKHSGLPDLADPDAENPYMWNQPGVHEIFKRWRTIADGYGRELTLLGEVWLGPADAADYIRAGELNQVFYFDLLQQPFDATAFRLSIDETLAGLKRAEGVATWALNSHDVHRAVRRPPGSVPADGSTYPWVPPGPPRPRCSCSPCPARPTCTRARSSGCPRCRTCPTTPGRTRSGSDPGRPSTAATAAASRCRGWPTRRRSGSPPGSRGCPSRRGSTATL
jgi:alpha-glucosidase